MKLIFSMPGVPSATPAQEKRAWIGPPHSSTAASMDALSDRSSTIDVTPSRVTGARSMTTTSAPASFTSSAAAAPIPVAPPTTTARLPLYENASNRPMCGCSPGESGESGELRRSGGDAADLEVDDRVPVEAELLEDLVPVLVEVGCP